MAWLHSCRLWSERMPVEPGRLWKLTGKLSWIHVTNVDHWAVIPFTPCSPLETQRLHPGKLQALVLAKEAREKLATECIGTHAHMLRYMRI